MVSIVQKLWQCKAGGLQRGGFSKKMKLGRQESVTSGEPCLVCCAGFDCFNKECNICLENLFNFLTIFFRLTYNKIDLPVDLFEVYILV